MKKNSSLAKLFLALLMLVASYKKSNTNFISGDSILDHSANANRISTDSNHTTSTSKIVVTAFARDSVTVSGIDSLNWVNWNYLYSKKLVNTALKKRGL